MLAAECMECGAILSNAYGIVMCGSCNTQYFVRRVLLCGGHILSANLSLPPTSFRQVSYLESVRTYNPIPTDKVIEYSDPLPDQDATEVFNSTICCICKDRLESQIQSVRVLSTGFRDVDYLITHPVSGINYTEVRSEPFYRYGRAHAECAVTSKEYQIVEHRIVPSKRQHTRTERRDYHDHGPFVEVPDVIEYDE